jgi:large subunit ribosomal protein L3
MAVDKRKGSPSFEQAVLLPATIIECPPIAVFAIRAYKNTVNGPQCFAQENAEKTSKHLGRRVSISDAPKPAKPIDLATASQIRLLVNTQPPFKKTPEIFEIPVSGSVQDAYNYAKTVLGKELSVTDMLAPGQLVDVIAVTKGKGIEGPVRRWGARVQYRKAHGKRRHVGAISPWSPRMVMWTALLAGQRGYHRRTEINKLILKVSATPEGITSAGGIPNYGVVRSSYVLLKGSVPGAKKRAVMMRFSVRHPLVPEPLPDVQSVSTLSQQGRSRF